MLVVGNSFLSATLLLQGNTSSDGQLEIANAIDALKGQICQRSPLRMEEYAHL